MHPADIDLAYSHQSKCHMPELPHPDIGITSTGPAQPMLLGIYGTLQQFNSKLYTVNLEKCCSSLKLCTCFVLTMSSRLLIHTIPCYSTVLHARAYSQIFEACIKQQVLASSQLLP